MEKETGKPRFLNPFTDFGFKRLFGEEYNKDLLIDFLNQLLKDEKGKIKSLQYMKSERLGRSETERRAVFDLYCENERGEKFIVEMQKTAQKFFKDRALYYSTFPIVEQARSGGVDKWNFELKAVYTVAILNFVFDDDMSEPDKVRYNVKLSDIDTKLVFYDKLTFIYLQMPKFNKTIDQLRTRYEKWLYLLKHLDRLTDIPEKFQDKIFKKLFKAAEISRFNPEEADAYEDSLKIYRDIVNSIDYAHELGRIEGKAEGKIEERLETAEKMIARGMGVELISELTGLKKEEIESLLNCD